VLVVRGTKKLRDRVRGASAGDGDVSTTVLGDWFATALFWRPQVALLVNYRTFLPVFVELAPAATLLDRMPAVIEAVLRRHGVDEAFLAVERDAMSEVRIGPTNDRSVVGVMNEFAFLGEHHWKGGLHDLEVLSLRMAHLPLGPLRHRTGFPDRELAAVVGITGPPAEVIAFPGQPAPAEPGPNASTKGGIVFQLKVTLLDTKPPIWRRVLVDGRSTLDHVHEVIQAAFGWWDDHLHQFEVGGTRYGVLDPDWDWDPPRDERRARLDAIAGEGTSLRYTYDFGDGWDHRVVVEKVRTATTAVPACIDGRRACPPEDCGGTWGYRDLLAILADPSHPEHRERLEWLGGPFDPDSFDPSDFEDNLRNGQLGRFGDRS
jgi:hypothetical protein